jgi:hypothetical protein
MLMLNFFIGLIYMSSVDLESTGNTEFAQNIIREIIQPSIRTNITHTLKYQKRWSKSSVILFTISKFLMGICALLSTAASAFNIAFLGYLSTACAILSIICNEYGTYAQGRDQNSTKKINLLLRQAGTSYTLIDTSALDAINGASNDAQPLRPNGANNTNNTNNTGGIQNVHQL